MALEPTPDATPADALRAPEPGPSLHAAERSARSLDDAVGREDFLRRLIEAARSAEAGAAARVWVFVVEAGRLEPTHESPAGRSAPRVDPLAGAGVVAAAWRSRRVAWSVLTASEEAWIGSAAAGAFVFRCDHGPERVLVAGWDQGDPGMEAAFHEFGRRARAAASRLEAAESLRRAEEERAALLEWMSAAASAHHLNEALRAAARAALRVSGEEVAAIWTVDASGGLALAHTAGERRDREARARALGSRAAEVVAQGPARRVVAVEADPADHGTSAGAAMVPVAAWDRVLGVIAVFGGGPGAGEARGQLEALIAVADGLGMVLDRAQRADADRGAAQEARELRARLRRRERLALAGERAAEAIGEARHPLASIGAFARRAQRELEESDPRREYLEVILRESERLERLISEAAAPVLPEPPRYRMASLNAILQDVLPGVGEKLVRRRVRLLKRLDPESPRLLLDLERIRQVFRNVIERAVESVPVGGRVRVESRLVRDHVIAEVAFDGRHAPGDLIEELFAPFAPEPGDGVKVAGVPGLGTADQIIRQHGGEIRVRADGEWGTIILVTLPVRDNDERRRPGGERRQSHRDRRQPGVSE